MATTDDDDWTTAAEARVLDAALGLAADRRWDTALCAAASAAAGLSPADAALLLPRGPADLAALLFQRHDEAALSALAPVDVPSLKVRVRLSQAVMARIDAAMQDETAVRRTALFLAAPFNAPLAAALGWRTADRLWRWAGDTATDENHYSKRAILSALLLSTLTVRLSAGRAAAQAHLSARIETVMRFEAWKARLPRAGDLIGDLQRRLRRPARGAETVG